MIFGGKKYNMPAKRVKTCHFLAGIVKFVLIFTHLKLLDSRDKLREKIFSGQMPPCAMPLHPVQESSGQSFCNLIPTDQT